MINKLPSTAQPAKAGHLIKIPGDVTTLNMDSLQLLPGRLRRFPAPLSPAQPCILVRVRLAVATHSHGRLARGLALLGQRALRPQSISEALAAAAADLATAAEVCIACAQAQSDARARQSPQQSHLKRELYFLVYGWGAHIIAAKK